MRWNLPSLLPRPLQYWYELNAAFNLVSAGADELTKSGNAKTLNSDTSNDLLDETNMTGHQYM